MQYFFFHLMPWPYLAPDFNAVHDSAWIWLSNAHFDPVKGHDLYQEYINTLAYADELGFDGVCVNEHHQNAYGLMPSPNVIAGALTQRTRRGQIAVIGNALPLYNPPLRVAEEFALLDVMSGGRLIAGMVIGGGPEYYSYQVNPTHARERFREALDLILKAWTERGPFVWNSKHYHFRYVNPWPRPLQQPHPPIWIPGVGSQETIDFVAHRRFAYMGVPYFHIDVFRRVFAQFREACEKAGYSARPEQMGWGVPIYVAETDRQAREEFEPHFWYFVRNLLKGIGISPPGYTSPRSALAILKNQNKFLYLQKTWEDVEKGVFALVGSPATVRQKLEHYQKELGVGVVLTGCQTGTLPHELARKSMELLRAKFFRTPATQVVRVARPEVLQRAWESARPLEYLRACHPQGESVLDKLKKLKYGVRVLLSGRGGQPETIDINGRSTVIMHAGEGPPFVYLHSTLGEAFRWLPFFQTWSKDFRVLVPTHPGFGKSGGFDEIDTIEDMAFHYVELFDALGLDEVILGGVSLGGWIAAEFAVRWPGRVKKLWLADAPGLWVEDQPLPDLFRHMQDRAKIRELLFHDPNGPMASMIIQERPDEATMLAGYQSMTVLARLVWERPYDPKLAGRLHRINCPTLLIWGDNDRLVPPAYGEAYRRLIPGAELKLIPNCGHLPMFEREAEFVSQIAAFAGAS